MKLRWQLTISSLFFLLMGLPVQVQALVPYDDFSGQVIDPQKWLYQEYVREIRNSKLVSKITAHGNPVTNNLLVKKPSVTVLLNYLESEITVTAIERVNGSFPEARIYGNFYNDGSSSTPGDSLGEVNAILRIFLDPDGQLQSNYNVLKSTNNNFTAWNKIGEDAFSIPINLGQTYRMSIYWDPMSNPKKFTFKVINLLTVS